MANNNLQNQLIENQDLRSDADEQNLIENNIESMMNQARPDPTALFIIHFDYDEQLMHKIIRNIVETIF